MCAELNLPGVERGQIKGLLLFYRPWFLINQQEVPALPAQQALALGHGGVVAWGPAAFGLLRILRYRGSSPLSRWY